MARLPLIVVAVPNRLIHRKIPYVAACFFDLAGNEHGSLRYAIALHTTPPATRRGRVSRALTDVHEASFQGDGDVAPVQVGDNLVNVILVRAYDVSLVELKDVDVCCRPLPRRIG